MYAYRIELVLFFLLMYTYDNSVHVLRWKGVNVYARINNALCNFLLYVSHSTLLLCVFGVWYIT